ncbi:hypothetical protein HDU84_008018 [Entophlyctis sp. JEL0112]|nr:hypothetical protein HDU84_008018 [Entophlyctis sp. JEL0112]
MFCFRLDQTVYKYTAIELCDLPGQLAFYMSTYAKAGIPARPGFEVGTPAYPDPVRSPHNQLPLTQAALNAVLAGNMSAGGMVWEAFKPAGVAAVDASAVLGQVCAKVFGTGNARCAGNVLVV